MKSKINKEFILEKLKNKDLDTICDEYNINTYFLHSFIYYGNKNFPIRDLILFARALKVEIADFFIEEDL